MHTLITSLKKENKLFIGDYDSYTIIRYGTSEQQLSYLSKIGLLLFDRLLLPAAFFWQSEKMHRLLLELEPAIAIGLVLPVIRDYETTTDIRDYFNRKMDESEKLGQISVFQRPELASEIASLQNVRYVNLLEDINSYAHLNINSIREVYQKNWINDLENHFDINSLRLLTMQANMPIEQIDSIISVLRSAVSHPQFSRASCMELINESIPDGRCRNLIEERASWLYLKSNADAYSSGFYYSHNPKNGMIFTDNLRLLAQTLSVFGLPEDTIAQLTIEDILRIRISTEYQHFIVAYRDLISKVYVVQDAIVAQIQRKIKCEIKKETRNYALYNVLNIIQACSLNVFISLLSSHFSNSDISSKVLIGSGSGVVFSSILKRVDSINSAMNSRPFSDFKNYIITKDYEKAIITHIGGNI